MFRHFLLLALASIGVAFTSPLHAANQWNGSNSQFWDDPMNWSLGIPVAAQDVVVDDSLAPASTLVSFQAAVDPMLASLVVDGAPASAMTLDLATKANFDVLTSGVTTVGVDGFGAFIQSGGTHTADLLTLGQNAGSDGRYTLAGNGTLVANGQVTVGASGDGRFAQTGGTHTVKADLVLGGGFNTTGRYTLSNKAQLKVQANTLIGGSGTGEFTQSGGTFEATGNLIVAHQHTGKYTMSAGDLVSTTSVIGFQADGTFTQSGGTHTASSLTLGSALGSNGSYRHDDGTLDVAGGTTIASTGDGQFVQNGGTHAVANDLVLGMVNGASGEYELNDGLLTIGNDFLIGMAGGGDVTQGGGSLQVTNMLVLGDAAGSFGSFTLFDGNLNAATGDTLVGSAGSGEFFQAGGTHQTNVLSLANNANTNGSYDLSGGILQSTSTLVGFAGVGEFVQRGGVHSAQALVLASSAKSDGSYALEDGTLAVNLGIVASEGTGTFTQSGGTFTTDELRMGEKAEAGGSYTLTKGTLTVSGPISIGMGGFGGALGGEPVRGVGQFTQDGGTVNAADLVLGRASLDPAAAGNGGGTGTYELKGGDVTVTGGTFVGLDGRNVGGTDVHGVGTFLQRGGTHRAALLAIGNDTLGRGRYQLIGGTLAITDISYVAARGNADMAQSGGTFTTKDFTIGNNTGGVGTFALSGGTATVGDRMFVGPEGMGTVTHSDGTLTTRTLGVAATAAAGVGAYTLSGGTLAVGDSSAIGTIGGGTFTQSGGTHTVANMLSNGRTGTLEMSAGSLTARTIDNDGIFNYSGGALTADITNRRRFNLNLAGGGQKVVTGRVTNTAFGIVKVNAGRVRWNGEFRNAGTYRSDPSENEFTTLIVEDSGVLEGGAGDLFIIGEDFRNSSTQGTLWNTREAGLVIAGADLHRIDFVGSDLDASMTGYDDNFAWGSFALGDGALLHVFDGNSANAGTAFYARDVLLPGLSASAVMNIFSDFNIYYDPASSANAYLSGLNYQLNGLGCLIAVGNGGACQPAPVPLPGAFLLMLSALAAGGGLQLRHLRVADEAA